MRYSQNPAVNYLQVSDDEVIVKAGHLEGFSLLVTDDTRRGLASRILAGIADGASAEEVHRTVLSDTGVSLDEVTQFLADLHASGAILGIEQPQAAVADWVGFLRYGEVRPPVRFHPLVLAGGETAAELARVVKDLGLQADHVQLADLDGVEAFAEPETAPPPSPAPHLLTLTSPSGLPAGGVAEETPDAGSVGPQSPAAKGGGAAEEDPPVPRLVVVSEGSSLGELYDLNEKAVAAGAAVFYIQVAGVEFAVGPSVAPGSTACMWEFERQRARSAFSFSEYAVLTAPAQRRTAQVPLVARRAVVAAATPYLVEVALCGTSSLAGQVLRGRATTSETHRYSVMRLPRCPVCLPLRPMLRSLLV